MKQNLPVVMGLAAVGLIVLVGFIMFSAPQIVPQNPVVVDYRCQDYSQKVIVQTNEVLFHDGSRCGYSVSTINDVRLHDELGQLTIQKLILNSKCKEKEIAISPYNSIADPNTEGLYLTNQVVYWCQGLFGT